MMNGLVQSTIEMAVNPLVVVVFLLCTTDFSAACVRTNLGAVFANTEPSGDEVCGPTNCRVRCMYDVVQDENGCNTCQCRQYPRHCDQKPVCYMHCEHGFMLGQDGCPLCQCRDYPAHCYERPMCLMACQYGFMTGSDGCPLCQCREYPAHCYERPMCMMGCPNGFVTGSDGCPLCQCLPSPLNAVVRAELTECQKQLQGTSGTMRVGAFTPQCEEDGSFSVMQCHGSTGYCWCVAEDGQSINEASPPGGSLRSCACIRRKYDEEQKNMIGNYIPQCELSGEFSPVQCHGSTGYCWCSDPEGNRESQAQFGQPGHC